MDILKTTALVLAVIFISNALPISKSNSSEDTMEDEWRTLPPCDKRGKYTLARLPFAHATCIAPSSSGHLDGTDIIWFVQENVRTGELRYPHGKPGEGRHRRDAVIDTNRLWPNGIVYYSINANLKSQREFFFDRFFILRIRLMCSEVRTRFSFAPTRSIHARCM